MKKNNWRIRATSIRGFNHIRSNKPNQDRVKYIPIPPQDNFPNILAISDGHSSEKCFRSEQGAEFAVETAIEVLFEIGKNRKILKFETYKIREWIQASIIPNIISEWRNKVLQDFDEHPFSEAEIQTFYQEDLFEHLENVGEKTKLRIYGATLLSVVIIEDLFIYLRIGDGDIFYRENDVTHQIFENRTFGVETNSLCLDNPENYFDIFIQNFPSHNPDIILASSDGYSNSFPDDDTFLEIAQIYAQYIADYGFDFTFEVMIDYFLERASRKGSGDDMSLGIIKKDNGTKDADHVIEEAQKIRKKRASLIRLARLGLLANPNKLNADEEILLEANEINSKQNEIRKKIEKSKDTSNQNGLT